MKSKYFLLLMIALLSINSANAQLTQVSGNVTSVPSNAPVFAKIIFTNINVNYNITKYTDSLTGNYSANLPAGTYKQEILVRNNYRYLDSNFVVTTNRIDSIETVEYFNTLSLIHRNGMFLIKILSGTSPGSPELHIETWKFKDRPIKIFADTLNAPSQDWKNTFHYSVNDIQTKFDYPNLYQEVSAAPDTGIQVHWVDDTPTPGGLGECLISARYPDKSPIKADIYINRNFPASNATMDREMMRALMFASFSQDQQMIMYYYGAFVTQLHPGEGESGKRIYRFKHIPKDMTPYDTTLVTVVTSINEESPLPKEFSLLPNYPNPFNPNTAIIYQLPIGSDVTLKVFDILGKEVDALVNEYKSAGTYELNWNAANLPSGIYFYRLQAGDPSTGSGQGFVQTRKMILLK